MTITQLITQDWRAIVAQRRKDLDSKIPQEWRLKENFVASLPRPNHLLASNAVEKSGILTETELDLTENYDATQLLQKLATGKLSSVAVTTAFCKRAAIAQQLTFCLTEHFFDFALERAKYLDDYLKREKKVVGPLHGLPISLKDSYHVKGYHTTIGYVSFLDHGLATSNSAVVDMLLDLGAVLYVKTNIPQTMLTADSDNNIYGRTLNPHNTTLTAGGSTGGEGALLALRGSLIGVGTDVAGSIRIPALCCGIYGFKPTTARIPYGGQVRFLYEGPPSVEPCAGPMTATFEDLELFMSTILNAEPWRYDVTTLGAPWTRPPTQSLLTIGVLAADEKYPLHPPVKRALQLAIEALTRKGHRIIYLDNDTNKDLDIAYANRLFWQYGTYAPRLDHVTPSGEPLVTSVAQGPSPMVTGSFPVSKDLGIFEKIHELHHKRQDYRDAWRKVWVDTGIDVILAPGAQNTAVPHDTYAWPPYTVVWNLLDYPACVIPYGQASKDLDPEPMAINDGMQPSYNPEAVDGAPCALQIITSRFQDEKCLAAARIIDRDIRE
ncbi:general amidase GmdB [Aspergillus sclerotioniger CBS 115572]|uniref:General amidase GmdB n=1 Tax=Aspergillus sclerotioniger CBS 115572 TaxID=1450535 RepID=A0A317X7L7_9EURO|nr:general amidase GmdB [Aspergillus sclerotioniger CBS 115572]PWY94529.1 general amidase GmdB [Aspergillus sclerotioniger CBS 115572]